MSRRRHLLRAALSYALAIPLVLVATGLLAAILFGEPGDGGASLGVVVLLFPVALLAPISLRIASSAESHRFSEHLTRAAPIYVYAALALVGYATARARPPADSTTSDLGWTWALGVVAVSGIVTDFIALMVQRRAQKSPPSDEL